ncbi:hypothetical protein [Viridibacillus arvi]|uniref:hypothetical protein n=1 Tax=Viridibacillus arvi TaxID=263475 RepID=UPI003CFD98E2
MDSWTWPLMAVILLICGIGYAYTRRIAKMEQQAVHNNDQPISQAVKDNPTMLNPIIWVYGLAFVFVFILIFYNVMKYKWI